MARRFVRVARSIVGAAALALPLAGGAQQPPPPRTTRPSSKPSVRSPSPATTRRSGATSARAIRGTPPSRAGDQRADPAHDAASGPAARSPAARLGGCSGTVVITPIAGWLLAGGRRARSAVLRVEGDDHAARAADRAPDPALQRLGALRPLEHRDQLLHPRDHRPDHCVRQARAAAGARLHPVRVAHADCQEPSQLRRPDLRHQPAGLHRSLCQGQPAAGVRPQWFKSVAGMFGGKHVPSSQVQCGREGVVLGRASSCSSIVVGATGLILDFPNFDQVRRDDDPGQPHPRDRARLLVVGCRSGTCTWARSDGEGAYKAMSTATSTSVGEGRTTNTGTRTSSRERSTPKADPACRMRAGPALEGGGRR